MVVDPQDGAAASSLAQLFPDRREEGDTTLRQCQLVMIRMLKILDHICQSEGISYWMTAGTLIGALRHRGMIPWDCDIDIGMTEEDYLALLGVTDQFPPDIFFQNTSTDPAYSTDSVVAKLRDRHSNYYEWQSEHPKATWHNGLQVDIFVYRRDEAGRFIHPRLKTPYARNEIFPLTRIEFEGAMLLAPNNSGDYISRRYGDYMVMPPRRKRIAHEGNADPFNPCDHPESRPYRRSPDVGGDGANLQLAKRTVKKLLKRVLRIRQ